MYRTVTVSGFVSMRYSVYRTATVTVTVPASTDEALCAVLVCWLDPCIRLSSSHVNRDK